MILSSLEIHFEDDSEMTPVVIRWSGESECLVLQQDDDEIYIHPNNVMEFADAVRDVYTRAKEANDE